MRFSFLKITILLAIIFLAANGCGVSKQAKQIKVLENCNYRIVAAEKVTLAGADLLNLLNKQEINLATLPGVALGFLNKNIPLKAIVNLEITNPTSSLASINQFDYKILIGDQEIADGNVSTPITIAPNQTTTIPVQINSNVYGLLSNNQILNGVLQAFKDRSQDQSFGKITVKIKPTFYIGQEPFKYPGYINISKEITTKTLGL